MLTEAGFTVKIDMTDMATWLKQMQSGPEAIPQLTFSRWSCACQDADGVLFPLLHSSQRLGQSQIREIDSLLEDARQTSIRQERLPPTARSTSVVAQERSVVPLYQVGIIYGAAKSLQWQPTPNESMFLNRMSWKD